MKFGKWLGIGFVLFGVAGVALRAELQEWVQHIPQGSMIAVFFRSVPMPGGNLLIRRPPAETRPALTDLIDAKPRVASFYRFRAHEDEVALDFTAAEADWRKYAQLASARSTAYTELADYFHRREEGTKEIAALGIVVQAKTDPIAPLTGQLPWRAVERTVSVADEEGLADSVPEGAFASWIKLHPADGNGYRAAADFEIAHQRFDQALATVASFAKQFPDDRVYPVQERAAVAAAQGSTDSAIAIYDASFDPLWPAELSTSYFGLLEKQGRLREFLGATRTILQNKPNDLNATARLFLYYQNQKNGAEAERALQAFQLAKESSKEPWTAADLWTLGNLFESLPNVNEAARCFYAMYSVPGATESSAEQALGALANLLLKSADQAIAFGAGDLSMYRDIAKVDESPGFLNGIFSLLFNSTSTTREYRQENEKSSAYFRRSTGARLVNLLAQRFPKSTQLPGLRAAVVQTCATYADDQCVLRDARAYLSAFPNGAERVSVALLLADALARQDQTTEEFALYDQLLKELAGRAQGVPIGAALVGDTQAPAARSLEYDRILQRYLSRLAELKRFTDVLRVYRREIDRNPNDPGLYREFAAYLDANRLDVPLIETYRRAMAKFPDRNWYHALARWYLREKRTDDFRKLTREVTGIFSGTQLDRYFANVVGSAGLSSQMYLQVCLYAHQRFPDDLVFVRDLLGAYQNRQTLDVAAYEELLRNYWFYDHELKQQFFQNLSEDHQLTPELEAVRKANASLAAGDWKKAVSDNPAAVQFAAEAEAWTSHFEAAAPKMRALAEAEPGEVQSTERAASIYRSLAAYDGANTGTAVGLEQLAVSANPRDRDLLERVGDIYADRDELNRAAPVWNAVLKIEPGKPESYLSAATVFWDYYRFDDALRLIADGRKKFDDPTLFAYEDGAVEEGQRDYSAAIHQYAAGAMAGDERAQSRLLRLALRKPFEAVVNREMARLGDDTAARDLRIAVLEKEQKRAELETSLSGFLERAKTGSDVVELAEVARRDGFDALQEHALEKQVALTNDPVDRMRLRIERARFYATRNKVKAQEIIDALFKDNPWILGVVRAAVDFETGQQAWNKAVSYLLDAAKNARPDLANEFTLEAARDAMSAKEFDQARTLLAGLLKGDPYRAEYLATLGTTYVLAGDDAGYEQFVMTTIKVLQTSPLVAEDKTARVAELRRGLIPTLTRRNEFAQAVKQYIEVLNRYPEDTGLATEAAGYAVQHGLAEQLIGFYQKTIKDAPRDYRWPIVLARVETRTEDFPAAISAYAMAMKDRPDRADVVEARALLEKRILRFTDAISTYSKLYELSYRNPAWMEQIAELHARLGQTDEAVKALRTAVIGQHTETAAMLFQIADRLDQWGMVEQSADYAENGAKLDLSGGEAIYIRVMARARRMDAVIANFKDDVPSLMPGAKVIASEYSPEEKAALDAKISGPIEWAQFAHEAEMPPLEARILRGQIHTGGVVNQALQQLNQLQLHRGEFEELGSEMEGYVKVAGAEALSNAATAYIAIDEREKALRVLEQLLPRDALIGPLEDWYLASVSRGYPDRLVRLAREATEPGLRDRAAQYAIANTDAPLALQAVAARGIGENALWNRAFTALTGLYFDDPQTLIGKSFVAALGSDPDIGTRVKTAPDRKEQLTGTLWFYYGSRYGDYLETLKRAEAVEFLPASLEAAPGNPEAYMALGRNYSEKKQTSPAVTEFRSALQLDATRVDAHDEIAVALWSDGKTREAIAEWRAGVATLERLQSRGVAVPPAFWSEGEMLISHVIASEAGRELKPDLERWIREYARINGAYQLDPLLTAAFDASLDAKEDTGWVMAIAEEYSSFDSLLQNPRLTAAQRIDLERRRLAYLAKKAALEHGDDLTRVENEIDTTGVGLIVMLLDVADAVGAQAEWKLLPEDAARRHPVETIRLTAAAGTLDRLLAGYRENPEQAPGFDVLQKAAMALTDKNHAAYLTVAEFMYSRELDAQRYDAGNFIGLADVYLERGQTDAAVTLLRRMNLIAGAPFETFVGAAELLEKHGKNAEAVPFLRDRVKAAPWDAGACLELAKLLNGSERDALLKRVIGDVHANYAVRVEAAGASNGGTGGDVATELGALASGAVTIDAAEKPYRVTARMVLASKETDPGVKMRLLRSALAIAPDAVPVRVAVLRAVLDAKRDSLALSTSQMAGVQGAWFGSGTEAIELAEDLSRAAERVDDLAQAIAYEQTAIDLRNAIAPVAARDARLKALQAEQARRVQNAARQPVIGPSIEQKTVVEPQILARKLP